MIISRIFDWAWEFCCKRCDFILEQTQLDVDVGGTDWEIEDRVPEHARVYTHLNSKSGPKCVDQLTLCTQTICYELEPFGKALRATHRILSYEEIPHRYLLSGDSLNSCFINAVVLNNFSH